MKSEVGSRNVELGIRNSEVGDVGTWKLEVRNMKSLALT